MKSALYIMIACFMCVTLHAQAPQSPKPGITVNGSMCLIQNTIWSCVPVDCDSVVIMQGDSIEYCTFQEIYLNTDSAYWMEWIFTGCDNMNDTVRDAYPTTTPLCYNPRWDNPGDYNVRIRYNGWLSAYPNADCYVQGPSEWNIAVTVLPDPNSIGAEVMGIDEIILFPQPAFNEVNIQGVQAASIVVRDCRGAIVLSASGNNSFIISGLPDGIYFTEVTDTTGKRFFTKLAVQQ
jgi:hypothetical protein